MARKPKWNDEKLFKAARLISEQAGYLPGQYTIARMKPFILDGEETTGQAFVCAVNTAYGFTEFRRLQAEGYDQKEE